MNLSQSGSVIVQFCGLSWSDQSSGQSAGTQQTEECMCLDPPLYSPLFSVVHADRGLDKGTKIGSLRGQDWRQERVSLLAKGSCSSARGHPVALEQAECPSLWCCLKGEMVEAFKRTQSVKTEGQAYKTAYCGFVCVCVLAKGLFRMCPRCIHRQYAVSG